MAANLPDQFANVGRCKSCGVDITICYQSIGDKSKPCILLLSEMAMSGISLWNNSFVDQLAQLDAFHIIRFDYRDSGKSTHLRDCVSNNNNNNNLGKRSNSSSGQHSGLQTTTNANKRTSPESIHTNKHKCQESNKDGIGEDVEHINSRKFYNGNKHTVDHNSKVNNSNNNKSNLANDDENDEKDESDDIIHELLQCNDVDRSDEDDNSRKVKKHKSKEKFKAEIRETKLALASAEPTITPSPTSSTLSIYIQLLRAFHTPGKYNVNCPYTLSDIAHDVWSLLRVHLSVEHVHLVGFSFGGMVAQMMAIQNPSQVQSLTLFATHSSNPVSTRWPSYLEILRYARLLPSSSWSLSSQRTFSSNTQRDKEHVEQPMKTKSTNKLLREKEREQEEQQCEDESLVNVFASALTRFMELIWGDVQRYPFDKSEVQRAMYQMCKRGIDVDGAFHHLAVLLNATNRDALLKATLTSHNTSYNINSTYETNPHNRHTRTSNCGREDKHRVIYTKENATKLPIQIPYSVSQKSLCKCMSNNKRYYIPTVVIQGTHDKLTPLSNAQHLASVIDGSELIIIDGMGHALLPALYSEFISIITKNVARANVKRTGEVSNYTPHCQMSHL